jgi:nucleoside permease NupC
LFALMSCGMAGIAGTVMVLYASLLGQVIPDALGNILIAAVISTPAALAIAALMVPFRPDAAAAAALRSPIRRSARWTRSPRARATASCFSPTSSRA